jgi:hypothetical protein
LLKCYPFFICIEFFKQRLDLVFFPLHEHVLSVQPKLLLVFEFFGGNWNAFELPCLEVLLGFLEFCLFLLFLERIELCDISVEVFLSCTERVHATLIRLFFQLIFLVLHFGWMVLLSQFVSLDTFFSGHRVSVKHLNLGHLVDNL